MSLELKFRLYKSLIFQYHLKYDIQNRKPHKITFTAIAILTMSEISIAFNQKIFEISDLPARAIYLYLCDKTQV